MSNNKRLLKKIGLTAIALALFIGMAVVADLFWILLLRDASFLSPRVAAAIQNYIANGIIILMISASICIWKSSLASVRSLLSWPRAPVIAATVHVKRRLLIWAVASLVGLIIIHLGWPWLARIVTAWCAFEAINKYESETTSGQTR